MMIADVCAQDGLVVLSWLCQKQPEEIAALGITEKQLEKLGSWLLRNGRLSMVIPQPEEKAGMFKCQCGCGQTFFSTYKTKPPIYKDRNHRMRAYRKRRKQREPEWRSNKAMMRGVKNGGKT